MGAVWQARDEVLGRDVAVKEIAWPPNLGAAEREILRGRAVREARTAAQLTHPNIVQVYDIVEVGGRPWIVMQLVPYRPLSDAVREDGPLSPQQGARVGLRILAALSAAHDMGVLHRDVKPGNVLLGPKDQVVLTDFGIAVAGNGPKLTTSGSLIGSPSYIAPERARGEPAGAAADLWSLGATVYAAVEGRPPFDRNGAMAVLTAVVSDEPDPPARAGPLWPVISGLLRKDPAERLGASQAEVLLRDVADHHVAFEAAQAAAVEEPTIPLSEPGQPPTGRNLADELTERQEFDDVTQPVEPVPSIRADGARTPHPEELAPEPAAVEPQPAARAAHSAEPERPAQAGPEPLIREHDETHQAPQAMTLEDIFPGTPTTPTTPATPTKSGARRRVDRTAALAVALLVALLVPVGIVAYGFLSGSRHGATAAPVARTHRATHHRGPNRAPPAAAKARPTAKPQTLTAVRAAAFGPHGDLGDNPERAPLAIDHNRATAWSTDWYANAHFGNLYQGTGILLDMGHSVVITDARITFGGAQGTGFQLRAGAVPTLADLRPVARAVNAGGVVRLRLTAPAHCRYVLIWFTSLPPGPAGTFRVSVHDVNVEGRP